MTRTLQIQKALRKITQTNFILRDFRVEIGHLVVEWYMEVSKKETPDSITLRKVVLDRMNDKLCVYDERAEPKMIAVDHLLATAAQLPYLEALRKQKELDNERNQ